MFEQNSEMSFVWNIVVHAEVLQNIHQHFACIICLGRLPSTTCNNNIRRGSYNTLILTDTQGKQHQVANRYGWSQHNYPCRGLKTGLVLYPADVMHKNTVLLLCDSYFYYHPNARGNRHEQLMRWYYNIYRSSKQFSLVSGFSVQPDGTFQFNNWQQQLPGLYTNNVNNMDGCEQDVIQQVVNGRIDSHTVWWIVSCYVHFLSQYFDILNNITFQFTESYACWWTIFHFYCCFSLDWFFNNQLKLKTY